jgi:predicted enzyme related to lactoylglutathione lyase
MSRVVHFEVHASDVEKIAKFYADVFGWETNEWVLTDVEMADENRYWLVSTGPESEPGINGGMLIRKSESPLDGQPVNAFVCIIDIPSIDTTLKNVQGAGGEVTVEKMAVPGMGWAAYCKDPDGNIFGLMEEDENAQ